MKRVKAWVVFLLLLLMTGMPAFSFKTIQFDFENGIEGWEIPDWAAEQKDCVGLDYGVTTEKAFSGDRSMKVDTNFPGTAWTAAVIEYAKDIDLSGYSKIKARIYIPKESNNQQMFGRIILTAGPWFFIEMKEPIQLKTGSWTTIEAKLDVSRLGELSYWKCVDANTCLLDNLKKVKRIAVRVEYNASFQSGPPYKGPVYIDDITID